MNPKISALLERLSTEAVLSALDGSVREAAAATGGLPIYNDIGGFLVLMPSGAVVHYDPDRKIVMPVTDARMLKATFVRAARANEGLRELLPVRPAGAITCEQCAGSGFVREKLACGTCMGTGWKEAH
jgi:hypothetical protein